MGVRSANAFGSLRGNAAGPHGAVLAADPVLAEFAVGGLGFYPILPGFGMHKGRHFFQLGGHSLHFLNGRKMFQGSQNNSPPSKKDDSHRCIINAISRIVNKFIHNN
jgi:hypothetical protein